jgi:hypothetical protein
MEVSAEWILGSFVALSGIIGTMAKLIYDSLHAQIEHQNQVIGRLQDDVDRLSQGCGVAECLWRNRDQPTFTGANPNADLVQNP